MMNGCPRWSILILPLLAAMGCSDPVPRPAQGNLTLSIQQPVGAGTGTCPVPGNTYVIAPPGQGPNSADPGTRVIDGQNGTTIKCSVHGDSTFTFSGTIKGQTSSTPSDQVTLTITNGTVNMDKATGTATMTANTSGLLGNFSSAAGACTVNVVSGNVKAGSIWATASCPVISDPSSPGKGCSIGPTTTFVLENCDGS